MKRDYIIMSDSSADLTAEVIREIELVQLPLHFIINNVEYKNDCLNPEMDPKEFYKELRSGNLSKSSAVNVEAFEEEMEKYCKEGKDILYLGFSSGLSATYNSGRLAMENLAEKYPERKLFAVDTLCASMGEGLIVYLACEKAEAGASIEEVRDYVENLKPHLVHWFTVDDLNHLKRGGRVSATSATIGTMLNIKPVLHVDDEGHLINMMKVRGRKASVKALFDKICETGTEITGNTIAISHGDCEEEARMLADMIEERFHPKRILFGMIGPVIGTHSGPGTIALFYVGSER